MKELIKTIRNAVRILAVLAAILIIFPNAYAQEIARDFSYPLKGNWSPLIYGYLGFGQPNHGLFQGNHLGQDTNFAQTPTGTKIYAIADGIVSISDNKDFDRYGALDKRGYAVVIDHLLPDGSHITSLYGHVQPGSSSYNEISETGIILVGSTVKKEQYIARVSDYWVGKDNWHHLHFGIRKGLYVEGHDWDYAAGYSKTGWNSDNTTHDTWYNPNEFIQNHPIAAIPPTLYRYADPTSVYNDRVYEIKNDAIGNTYSHWIIDPKVFSDLGYNTGTIYDDEDGYNLNHYITGENMVFRDGTLIKRPDGRIYEVRNGEKHWFPTWDSFSGRGHTLDDTYAIADQKANLLPTGMTMDYRLVKTASSGNVYIVQANEATGIKEKKHIMDPDAMSVWGFDWSKIETISDTEMNSYPYTGELGHIRYETFIGKSSDRSATYFLSADESGNIVKRKIAADSIKNYLTNGIPKTTYWLSDSEFNSVPEDEEYKRIQTSYAVIIPTDPSDCAACHIEPMTTSTPTPTEPPSPPPEPTPDPPPSPPIYDVNQDGQTNMRDLFIVAEHFGESTQAPYPRYDVNQDNATDIYDVVLASSNIV